VTAGPDEAQEAALEGDRPYHRGSARALRHADFRRLYLGAFLSNVGTWMQNVVLGAYAYELTGSSSFVGLLVFAQLGPMLALPLIGGYVADVYDRRRMLLILTFEQLFFSGLLAVLVAGDAPSRTVLVATVVVIGAGAGLYGPAYSALLPSLVGRADLASAVSLNATQMNASRVVGPALGGILFAAVGPAWVFAGNAVSYVFVLLALFRTRLPKVPTAPDGEPAGFRRLLVGFQVARRDRVVGAVLVTISAFSLFSLPVVGQFPVLAGENLGIDVRSGSYGVLYASFGLGAVAGSIGTGILLAERDRLVVARRGMVAFAVALAVFSVLRSPEPAYLAAFALGTAYFVTITSLMTALQERLEDHERGRVMALWMMGWGGTVPIGNLIAGPIIDATSVTPVLLVGAAIAVALAWRPALRHESAAAIGAMTPMDEASPDVSPRGAPTPPVPDPPRDSP
jgi:MFS family permease